MPNSRQILPIAVGLSICGVSAYLFYLYLKKDDENDDDIPKKSCSTISELRVPRHVVPSLIGRGGCNIKSIQDKSGCRVQFKDDDREDTERTCILRGDADSIRMAKVIIADMVASLEMITTEEMWVPQTACGRVIGGGGANITRIMRSSNTKVVVESTQSRPNASTRKVTIKGTPDQIAVAKSMIDAIVAEDSEVRRNLARRQPRGKPLTKQLNADSNSISTKPVQVVSEKLAESGQSDGQIEVYVSAVEDPGKFWVQIVGTKATELDQLVDHMTEYYNNPQNAELHKLQDISVGEIVAAMFHFDKKIYRAEIIETNVKGDKKMVNLYYVDYGDTNWVESNDVFELRTDFLRLRFQAIECFLAAVQPTGNQWSEEATDLFENLTQVARWKKMWSKIVCYKERSPNHVRGRREGSPIPGVELYDNNKDGDVNIAEELVKNGFATYEKDESKKTAAHSGRASSEGKDSGQIFASTPYQRKAQTVLIKMDESSTVEDSNLNSTINSSIASDKNDWNTPSSSNVNLTYHTPAGGDNTMNSSSTFIDQETTNSAFNGNSTYTNGNVEKDLNLNESTNLAGGDFSTSTTKNKYLK